MMMSRGGNRPQGPPPEGGKGGGGPQGVEASNGSSYVSELLESLNASSTEETTTTDDLTAELLEALDDTDSTYTAAEIAQYDTNGDGSIDTSEEASMEAALAVTESEETSTQDQAFQKAIDAYMKQNTQQYSHTATDDAFKAIAV